MRDKQANLFRSHSRLVQHLVESPREDLRGELVHLSPVHLEIVFSLLDSLVSGRRARAAGGNDQVILAGPIRSKGEG